MKLFAWECRQSLLPIKILLSNGFSFFLNIYFLRLLFPNSQNKSQFFNIIYFYLFVNQTHTALVLLIQIPCELLKSQKNPKLQLRRESCVSTYLGCEWQGNIPQHLRPTWVYPTQKMRKSVITRKEGNGYAIFHYPTNCSVLFLKTAKFQQILSIPIKFYPKLSLTSKR